MHLPCTQLPLTFFGSTMCQYIRNVLIHWHWGSCYSLCVHASPNIGWLGDDCDILNGCTLALILVIGNGANDEYYANPPKNWTTQCNRDGVVSVMRWVPLCMTLGSITIESEFKILLHFKSASHKHDIWRKANEQRIAHIRKHPRNGKERKKNSRYKLQRNECTE